MNWGEQAIAIARDVLGDSLTDDELGAVLWNETGFPCFFDGDPATVLRQQLEDYRRFGPLLDMDGTRRNEPKDSPR